MQPRLFCVSVLALAISNGYSQSNPDFSGPFPKTSVLQEAASPKVVHRKGFFSSKKAKSLKVKKQKVTHSAQFEFYERVEQAAKDHQKQLKKFSKPQYTNFLYYGHRRLPKRRPPHKMRFCNECGIRH
jgi:hypothetical protein